MDTKKISVLLDNSERCWKGRVGEYETQRLVGQMTEGWSEQELKRALSILLDGISRYGRKALARQCPHLGCE